MVSVIATFDNIVELANRKGRFHVDVYQYNTYYENEKAIMAVLRRLFISCNHRAVCFKIMLVIFNTQCNHPLWPLRQQSYVSAQTKEKLKSFL